MTVRVYDFFSGCGGASCGFRDAGMTISYALDRDADAMASFKANFPEADFHLGDIRNAKVKDLRSRMKRDAPDYMKKDARDFILFSGCAPCQPFTRQNTSKPNRSRDARAPLLVLFGRLVEKCRPNLVFVENVPGIQKPSTESEPFRRFLKQLAAADYKVEFHAPRLAAYGVPQTRRRLLLLASRHGPVQLPAETHGPGKRRGYVTVRDAIAGLPPIRAGETHESLPNHRAAALSPRNLERVRATPEGGGHRDWPADLRLRCHRNFSGYTDVYGRMSWNAPASALTTRCISYSNGRFGHPEQDRAISIREAALLQTFPGDFVFKGSTNSIARQIGNAVPVRLASLIGRHFINHIATVKGGSA